jgi:SAM-dependent methyltransferase
MLLTRIRDAYTYIALNVMTVTADSEAVHRLTHSWSCGSIFESTSLKPALLLMIVPVPRQGDFNQMPFDDNTFDAAYAMEATCHSEDLSKVFGEVCRILKPGGIFAVYDWVMTDKFDSTNAYHCKLKNDILVMSLSRQHKPFYGRSNVPNVTPMFVRPFVTQMDCATSAARQK